MKIDTYICKRIIRQYSQQCRTIFTFGFIITDRLPEPEGKILDADERYFTKKGSGFRDLFLCDKELV